MKIKYSVCFNSVCSSRSFVSNVFWISSVLCGVIIVGLSWQQNFTKICPGGCGSYNRVSIIPTQLWSGSDQDACLTGWKFEIRAYHLWSSNNHGANFILSRGHLNVASQNTLVFTYWSLNLQPVSLPLHVSVIGFHRILFFLCLLSCRHFIKKCCKEIKNDAPSNIRRGYPQESPDAMESLPLLLFLFRLCEPPPATINVMCLYCQFVSRSMTPLCLQLCQWG